MVDDAQWLDQASAQALGFAARRLRPSRWGWCSPPASRARNCGGLPELAVAGCAEAMPGRCWTRCSAGPLDERVRDRIVAETQGNPLALLELPRGCAPAELAGGFGLPGAGSLAGRIEESFRRRLEALPAADPAADAAGGGRAVR